MIRLFLLFTVIPAAEIAILIAIGSAIGPLPTFLMLVLSGVVGAWFAKREGLAVLRQLGHDAATGLPPAERVVEAALVAAGGLLLVTPGLLTDVAGLLLVVPWTRRRIAPHVLAWGRRNVTVLPGGPVGGIPRPPSPPRPAPPSSPFDHPVA